MTTLLRSEPKSVHELLTEIEQPQTTPQMQDSKANVAKIATQTAPKIFISTPTPQVPSSLPQVLEHLQNDTAPDPLVRAHIQANTHTPQTVEARLPSNPIFLGVGERFPLPQGQRDIFIRDESLLTYRRGELIALSGGQTEIYFVENGQMQIIPVGIEEEVETQPQTLLTAGHYDLTLAAGQAVTTTSKGRDSYKVVHAQHRNVPLQILDAYGTRKPIAGIQIQISGSDKVYTTNTQGFAEDLVLPQHSRLWATARDPHERYADAALEIETSNGQQSIRMIPTRMIDSMTRSLNIDPIQTGQSLLCLHLENAPEQSELFIEPASTSSFSFDEAGFPVETHQLLASQNICFWGVNAQGPSLISLTTPEGHNASFPIMVHPDHSTTIFWDFNEQLTSTATVREYSPWNPHSKPSLALDFTSIEPIGDYRELNFEATSCATPSEGVTLNQGRAWFWPKEDLYEPLLYQYDKLQLAPWHMNLIHRGFLEQMTDHILWDQNLGGVLVEHHPMGGQKSDTPDVRLVDIHGKEHGELVTTHTADRSFFGFFNLPAGSYNLILSDGEDWLQGHSVLVYEGTTSFLQAGSLTYPSAAIDCTQSIPMD
ncbi:MAG: hypothetical protein AB8C84_06885 [Oligoflexales bacterium]